VKPYILSVEHLVLNYFLIFKSGFKPISERFYPPEELIDNCKWFIKQGIEVYNMIDERGMQIASTNDIKTLLYDGPLRNEDGIIIHRAVLSEPMGIVPYDLIYYIDGEMSPAAQYDDPGLFETRPWLGLCPWRDDCTGTFNSKGLPIWGDNERKAYCYVHNYLVKEVISNFILKNEKYYGKLIAYVGLSLTHRSFISSKEEKREENLKSFRRVKRKKIKLLGVNDILKEKGLQKQVILVPRKREFNKILRRPNRKTLYKRLSTLNFEKYIDNPELLMMDTLELLLARILGG